MKLGKFCARDGATSRTYLEKPIYAKGFLYATDGHICIRVPDSRPTHFEPPFDIEKLFLDNPMGQPHSLVRHTMPEVPLAGCDDCHGGRVHECPACKCECRFCEGTGKIPDDNGFTSVEIFGYHVHAKYFRMLLGFKDLRMAPPAGADKPIAFTFRDGFKECGGRLMPLKIPTEEQYFSVWFPE